MLQMHRCVVWCLKFGSSAVMASFSKCWVWGIPQHWERHRSAWRTDDNALPVYYWWHRRLKYAQWDPPPPHGNPPEGGRSEAGPPILLSPIPWTRVLRLHDADGGPVSGEREREGLEGGRLEVPLPIDLPLGGFRVAVVGPNCMGVRSPPAIAAAEPYLRSPSPQHQCQL